MSTGQLDLTMIGQYAVTDTTLIPRRDRAWRHTMVVRAVGPLSTPTADRVRTRLEHRVGGAGTDPRFRALDLVNGLSGRIADEEADRFVSDLVITSGLAVSDGIAVLAAACAAQPLDGLPFRLTLGADWAALYMSHALGDASTWRLLSWLLAPYEIELPDHASSFAPVTRGVLKTFGTDPGRTVRLLRASRGSTATPEEAAAPTPRATTAQGGAATVWAASAPGLVDRLRAQTRTTDRPTSVLGILVARAATAAAESSLRLDPSLILVADARRYLPEGMQVASNFLAAGVVSGAVSDDPADVTATIRAYLDSGKPMAAMAAGALQAHRPAPVSPSPASLAAPTLSVSFGARWEPPLPFDDSLQAVTVVPPTRPDVIGLNLVQIAGRLHATVNYNRGAISADTAQAIAGALVAD